MSMRRIEIGGRTMVSVSHFLYRQGRPEFSETSVDVLFANSRRLVPFQSSPRALELEMRRERTLA